MSLNLPISYDFHGDIPFTTPFAQIKPTDIHIYLDLDTKIGSKTCGQACSHCWFVNYEKVQDKSFDVLEGKFIKEALQKDGFKVFARYTDSFAYKGDFMRVHGPAHNREFRQDHDHTPTETMVKGDAWTSGKPLLADNYVELLDLAHESGYGTISITYHGLIDENLKVMGTEVYPLTGVFSGADTEKVIARVYEYNKQNPERTFRINIGVTLGRHNNSRQSLIRYAQYFNNLKVASVRFNNFTDHGGRHPDLPMSKPEIEQAYRDMKWLHENVELNFQMGVSEDFGNFGIEVMNFPAHVGLCQAGRQLFTAIPAEEEVLKHTARERVEKIGEIVGCVNIFKPTLGYLARTTDYATGEVDYSVEFDHEAIESFTLKRLNGHYKNGCFAKELKEEEPLVPTKQALAAIAKLTAKNTYTLHA